ncbi:MULTISPECIES: VOC family protein [Pseudofrankia]|uniref:VOC family protein n=1 Tax=Pseudofrankia TaxID=2994363 RepID=UPI000234C210|nr:MULTISPECIES: VOC family protein [Pseudofrankia]OHV31202.1 glyoxalase [Pseudofrankia sp. EUN1h]
MTSFPAVTHVAVTVTDLETSVPWYTRLFGAEPVLDEDTGPFRHVVFALDGGQLFGLHHFPEGTVAGEFSPRRVGLDHVAFGCADRAELEAWCDRLERLDIKHGGIVDAHYGSGLAIKDPDDIALEFFAPPAS